MVEVDHLLGLGMPDLVDGLDHPRPGRRPSLQRRRAAPRGALRRRAHPVGLAFQRRIVVDRLAGDRAGRLHPALALLRDMPGLVRQVLLLARRDVDLLALRIGQRVQLRRLGRVGLHPHVRHVDPRERLDPVLQAVGHPGPVPRLGRRPQRLLVPDLPLGDPRTGVRPRLQLALPPPRPAVGEQLQRRPAARPAPAGPEPRPASRRSWPSARSVSPASPSATPPADRRGIPGEPACASLNKAFMPAGPAAAGAVISTHMRCACLVHGLCMPLSGPNPNPSDPWPAS